MKYYVVDAFADKVFEGNPAGVCILAEWISEDVMQKIAIENNLSETAFAVKESKHYKLRWFTPGGEINLCGHATLATAFVIMNYVEPQITTIHFDTMSGVLTVVRKEDLYELNFPAAPLNEISITKQMIDAIGATPIEAYLNRDLLFVFDSEETVKNLSPDFAKLTELPEGLGVIVTAKGTEFDFVSRAFFPKLKITEDPVCGSAHCGLVPYWAEKLKKNELIARQVSSRGGTLYCTYENTRVKMAGKAALYLIGDINIE
ncbi:PhzF family phenazine biosynthesis protein [Ureibacillus endophyticus]|uniref:PhzF family phenazine biosynthesis protein n=1 Tax=Ureibacillus endophyticus TaxID=1978490 RepID=A0A494Z726_9BACL|nr:PhzF family phenazine biosynthesis protein [Lysinibacillus endophyticus]RKQ18385.1 PhzF family phenazine biosynthesis protein [Lysinibacillus endophyticus]